jgi:hypothetical protein
LFPPWFLGFFRSALRSGRPFRQIADRLGGPVDVLFEIEMSRTEADGGLLDAAAVALFR